MQTNLFKKLRIITITTLLIWLCFFLFQKIGLATADLGRFLKNGENIFNGNFKEILNTNFYSYTFAQYPFLNHHWGTGVIFYLIYKIGGFLFLHLFSITLILSTFFILFKITEKKAGLIITTLFSLLLIPLMAYRREIRPELFSGLFSSIFVYILWSYRDNRLSPKKLLLLPFIEILWVNLHIYFFLGPAIIGAFILEKLIFYFKNKKEILKPLFYTFGGTIIATLINPFGWKGAVHPFMIYNNYGYKILEEQSVWFLENLNINNPNFLFFKIILFLIISSFVWMIIKKRSEFQWVNFFLIIGFGFMACLSIRNISLFAFISLPILAWNFKILWPKIDLSNIDKKIYSLITALIIVIVICIEYGNYLPANSNLFGLGVIKYESNAIDFFKKNNLKGPIFNNYDIGGYLIYHLYPQEKVFVDNRPETYPPEFFQNIYIPMQENEKIWKEKSKEYNFNTIFFYLHDATSWGQQFMISRVQDKEWIPVFADDFIIIFVKDNEINKNLIKKHEIPQNAFKYIY
ncbi:MAG: hypothetical protein V1851_01620 [Patescibacteria group bacterium]